jgi:hypothetical protein
LLDRSPSCRCVALHHFDDRPRFVGYRVDPSLQGRRSPLGLFGSSLLSVKVLLVQLDGTGQQV